MFWYGLTVAFWGVFEYLVTPLTVLLVLLPTGYAIWLVRKDERQYNIREGEGGWLVTWSTGGGGAVGGRVLRRSLGDARTDGVSVVRGRDEYVVALRRGSSRN